MNELQFDRFKTDWLLIRDLQPHPKVQRPFNEAHAKRIADNFDPDKFRPLDVIPRASKYLVFAGQHRLAAARMALGEDQRLPCHVHEDKPIEQQAAICLGVDNMLGWNTLDRWRLRILAKEEVPIKIEAVLHRHTLRVDKYTGEGIVRAVAALEYVYTKHGGEPALDRTLQIIDTAYERHKEAYDATMLRAIGLLVHRFGEQLNDEELARKLGRHSGPGKMLGAARDYAKATGVSVIRAMAEKICQIYDKGVRKARLEF